MPDNVMREKCPIATQPPLSRCEDNPSTSYSHICRYLCVISYENDPCFKFLQSEGSKSHFCCWAEAFFKEMPPAILRRGISIVVAVRGELSINPRLLPRNAKREPELRQRLLRDASFQRTRMGSGTKYGQVHFCGIALIMLQFADLNTTRMQCDLSLENVGHPASWATDTIG